MITPPKDKPVRKDDNVSAEEDELQSDEAVAAADSEIKSADQKDGERYTSEEDASDELNTDQNDVGLNEDQGEEFL
jgi:hypothetical protein